MAEPGGGGLQKLRISHDKPGGTPIEAMFNPEEISRSRSVEWERKPVVGERGGWSWAQSEQQFRSVAAETMSITLFFDTYEPRSPGTTGPSDVRTLTDRVAELAEIDGRLYRPPVCRLSWGAFTDIFTGVLTGLSQRFTMFLTDGTPVRASVSCDFVEFATRSHAGARRTGATATQRTVLARRSDSLQGLAAQEYGDPSQWRRIANANDIANPRRPPLGRPLRVPERGR